MAIPKKHRIGFRIDMTPMVDVAFLLLIFFMSTTQFKSPEAKAVQLPDSHSAAKLPESDVLIISIDDSDRVYMTLNSPPTDVKLKFLAPDPQTGQIHPRAIPKEEFQNAILNAALTKPGHIRITVKADKAANFGIVEDLMAALQTGKQTRFNFVTNLLQDNAGAAVPAAPGKTP